MKDETRRTIIAVVAVAAVFGVAYVGIIAYAGTSSPFYTVESGSMGHTGGSSSQIGIIDAGDMVLARDPSKMNITTYIEGHGSGYNKFGDYGDVIVYDRPGNMPVIHRAILYVEYNGDGTWNIPSLKSYAGVWDINGIPGDHETDVSALSGVLHFEGFGFSGNKDFTVNLGVLGAWSGYITMGDANAAPDQMVDISPLVRPENVMAVAAVEIPWLGAVKMYAAGNNTNEIPSNTLPSLIVAIVLIFLIVIAIGVLYDLIVKKK